MESSPFDLASNLWNYLVLVMLTGINLSALTGAGDPPSETWYSDLFLYLVDWISTQPDSSWACQSSDWPLLPFHRLFK